MRTEAIAEIGMDAERRMFVRAVSGDFEHVYRAAMEVYWDRATGGFRTPGRQRVGRRFNGIGKS